MVQWLKVLIVPPEGSSGPGEGRGLGGMEPWREGPGEGLLILSPRI